MFRIAIRIVAAGALACSLAGAPTLAQQVGGGVSGVGGVGGVTGVGTSRQRIAGDADADVTGTTVDRGSPVRRTTPMPDPAAPSPPAASQSMRGAGTIGGTSGLNGTGLSGAGANGLSGAGVNATGTTSGAAPRTGTGQGSAGSHPGY
jgi:hypothetical protein